MIKVFLVSSLDVQSAPGMSHFFIQNAKVINFQGLTSQERKLLSNEKNLFSNFLVKWKYLRKT